MLIIQFLSFFIVISNGFFLNGNIKTEEGYFFHLPAIVLFSLSMSGIKRESCAYSLLIAFLMSSLTPVKQGRA
jgi:hypothetical protein